MAIEYDKVYLLNSLAVSGLPDFGYTNDEIVR
jgi:hypothetical protein